jgi:Family of unknown function (DUF5871)
MEYAKPQKLPDGRYFLKITSGGAPVRHQVNGLTLQDNLDARHPNFEVADPSLFKSVDEEILSKAKELKQEWFGKELSDETIVSAYQESVTDGVLGASLAIVRGEVATLAFDTAKTALKLEDVKADTKCDVVFELSGLWFLKKSFGPIWRVVQVRVRTPVSKVLPQEYIFTDEPEVEENPADYLD